MNEDHLHQQIFRVAYDIYERSGRVKGRDLDNWLEAEKIVRTLRQIAGEDDGKHSFVNFPMAKSDEEEEYGKWMITFFQRQSL